MADGESGAGAAAIAGEGGESGGAITTQPWVAAIDGLPDDLKADPTINRYTSPVDALKGLLHHKQVASTRLAVPGKDAKPEDWNPVYDALGRPKTAAEYDFGLPALPDDADVEAKTAREEMTKRYAELFHPLGLNSNQAAALVKADVARIEQAMADHAAKGKAELDTLKTEMGADYEPQLEAAKKLYAKLFPDREFADALDDHLGSAALVKGFMKLAKLGGEHFKVGGEGGDLTPGGSDPQSQLNAKMADQSWRAKYLAGDTAVVAEYERLERAAQGKALAAS